MPIYFYIIIAIAAVIIFFIIWRLTSVSRGLSKVNKRIFKSAYPIWNKVDADEPVTKEEVFEFAKKPELRHILFMTLRNLNLNEIIPSDFDNEVHQAESSLCYWMMHPNELQDPPETIEFIKTLTRTINDQEKLFYFFKYKMPKGHWAGQDWLIGFVGPIEPLKKPYEFPQNAFTSANHIYGKISCEEILEWWTEIIRSRGIKIN